MADDDLLQKRLEGLLRGREPPKTICPSEVPRSLTGDELQQLGADGWRDLMPKVRELLWAMRERGEVEVLQRGASVDPNLGPEEVKGPIRARRKE